jgi:hypothetical protein
MTLLSGETPDDLSAPAGDLITREAPGNQALFLSLVIPTFTGKSPGQSRDRAQSTAWVTQPGAVTSSMCGCEPGDDDRQLDSPTVPDCELAFPS